MILFSNGVEETKAAEEEVKEYTLDEWKRMQNQGKKSQPSFNLRKPNEGEDNAQWKKTYLLTKKKEEEPAEEYEEITYEVSFCYHRFVATILLPSSLEPLKSQIIESKAGQICTIIRSGVLGVEDQTHCLLCLILSFSFIHKELMGQLLIPLSYLICIFLNLYLS